MNDKLEFVANQISSIFVVFFKHLFRADQNKIEKGLGRIHFEVLSALDVANKDGELISLSELAKRLMISKAYTTALTDRLFEEGLLDRLSVKNDRRIIKVKITEKGIKELNNKNEESIKTYKERLSALNNEDLEILSNALEDLKKILTKIKVND